MMSNTRRIKAETLMQMLPGDGVIPFDGYYSLHSREWYTTRIDKYIATLKEWGVAEYLSESGDCDDFAIRLFQMVRDEHAREQGKVEDPSAPAFGMISYKIDEGGWHAINIAVVLDDNTPTLIFIEPQIPPKEVELSHSERRSIRRVII